MGETGNETTVNGHGPVAKTNGESKSFNVKAGLAKMLKGGVIMDVVNADQVSPLQIVVERDSHVPGPHCRRSRRMRSYGT